MLARMHLAGDDFALQQPHLRGLAWWVETVPVVLPHLAPAQATLLQDELAFQQQLAGVARPAAALPRGPIHADLFRDNVMFDDTAGADRLCGFFDFYFAGTDTLLFDIAVCLNDWCIDLASGTARRSPRRRLHGRLRGRAPAQRRRGAGCCRRCCARRRCASGCRGCGTGTCRATPRCCSPRTRRTSSACCASASPTRGTRRADPATAPAPRPPHVPAAETRSARPRCPLDHRRLPPVRAPAAGLHADVRGVPVRGAGGVAGAAAGRRAADDVAAAAVAGLHGGRRSRRCSTARSARASSSSRCAPTPRGGARC